MEKEKREYFLSPEVMEHMLKQRLAMDAALYTPGTPESVDFATRMKACKTHVANCRWPAGGIKGDIDWLISQVETLKAKYEPEG